LDKLSEIDDICGRDIKNAVVKAAIKTAIDGEELIKQVTLETAIKDIIDSNNEIKKRMPQKLSSEEKTEIEKKLSAKLKEKEKKNYSRTNVT
ncbi:MAG: hypothetical protein LBJ47_05285, partial [Tannerella sp.]|jgi:hypothetical protein|nr:hypothetical protein [Tannerella sp.]